MAGVVVVSSGCKGGGNGGKKSKGEDERSEGQLSMTAMLMTTIRKSMVYCRMNFQDEDVTSVVDGMDIGWPTEVQHVAHVTFDRFNGFLGLPVEFELEVSCRPPSASASVFGVSAELMQCGFDSKGNSIPIILLLMQERLYSQGGLKAEGIFRITAENSEEKDLRNQLNKGIIPDDIDVHCLAGLIKAWFRELPEGVLDSLSPAQVLQCETEEDCAELVKLLPPMQFALVKWVIDLMADVVEEEEVNKMNARNIAMVFAPNMTQLSDPLTSLMHAVQVMNLLQTLIFRTLRERDEEEEARESDWPFSCSPSYDGDEHETDELMESSSDNDCEVGASDDLRRDISIDFHSKNADRSIDIDENVELIEDCFLRHLELVSEGDNGDLERELIVPHMDFGGQATQFSSSELSSCDSSTTKSNGNQSTSSSTMNEVPYTAIVPEDVVVNAKPSDPIEDGKELEMDVDNMDFGNQATKLSCSDLSSGVSSIMKSETNQATNFGSSKLSSCDSSTTKYDGNQSTSSRTITEMHCAALVPDEDGAANAKPSDPIEDGKELEMDVEIITNDISFGDQAIKLSCTKLSSGVCSIMKSETNQSTSSRTIDNVDSVIVVPEDWEGDTEPSDQVEIIGNHINFGYQATTLSCTELISIMKFESNQSTSLRTINDVESVIVVPEDREGDAEPSDPIEMIRNHMDFGDQATKLSCTELSSSVSSIMISESNQSTSLRAINDVDIVVLVPEDREGEAEPSVQLKMPMNWMWMS